MEFDKSRVYTSLNADELKAGDKVIVANSPYYLKKQVEEDDVTDEIMYIAPDTDDKRFRVDRSGEFALAYLVERKENCTNCGEGKKDEDYWLGCTPDKFGKEEQAKCWHCDFWEPKTEQKAEPHYRPFKDTEELVKVWCEKGGKWQKRELTMPYIWVNRLLHK